MARTAPLNPRRVPGPPPPLPVTKLVTSVGILIVMLVFLQLYARRQIASTLDLGAGMHQACAIAGVGATQHPASIEDMQRAMGALAPMLQPIVNNAIGAQLSTAFQCTAMGRTVWEVILHHADTSVSVIVMRKGKGDSFPRALGSRVDSTSGVRLHQGDAKGYAVDGFIAGEYVGYVVSAMPDEDNLALAKNLAPVIQRYTQGGAK